MPNLSFLSYLVRPIDSFIINKGYIAKKILKIAKSMSNHQKSHLENIELLDLYQRIHHGKNQLRWAVTVANDLFCSVLGFYTKTGSIFQNKLKKLYNK